MKVLILILALGSFAQASDVYVNGYTRTDGTYVPPHMRTAPDNSIYNNYYGNQQEAQPEQSQQVYVPRPTYRRLLRVK